RARLRDQSHDAAAGRGRSVVDWGRGLSRRVRRHGRRRVSGEPRLETRSHHRAPLRMTKRRLASTTLLDPARIAEGIGIALESIRVSKARAALTILGVAIGVMVVIAMASMITGITRGVTGMMERAGPKTFMVMRFFRGGVNIDDGSDERSPWRKNP